MNQSPVIRTKCQCCFLDNRLNLSDFENNYFQCSYCHSWCFIGKTYLNFLHFRIKPLLIFSIIDLFNKGLHNKQIYAILQKSISFKSVQRVLRVFKRQIQVSIETKWKNLFFNDDSDYLEINETFLPKEKRFYRFARRRPVRQYLFCIVSRKRALPLIMTIDNRRSETLVPIILKHIGFGNRIISDCFSVYVNNNVTPKESNLTKYGFRHYWVDHSVQFVSYVNRNIHINNTEALWSRIKVFFRKLGIKQNFDLGVALFYYFT